MLTDSAIQTLSQVAMEVATAKTPEAQTHFINCIEWWLKAVREGRGYEPPGAAE